MTVLTILIQEKGYRGFRVTGHSGYGESGSDIVCATVSSAVQQTMIALTGIMNLSTEATVSEESAEIAYLLPVQMTPEQRSVTDIILKAFEENCLAISGEYPEYVRVTRTEV